MTLEELQGLPSKETLTLDQLNGFEVMNNQVKAEPKKTFLGDVGQKTQERAKGVIEAVSRPRDILFGDESKPIEQRGAEAARALVEAPLRVAGEVTGEAFDILGAGIGALVRKLPEGIRAPIRTKVQEVGRGFLETRNPFGETNAETIKKLSDIAEQHPEAVENITSALNIAGVLGLGKLELAATGGKGVPGLVSEKASQGVSNVIKGTKETIKRIPSSEVKVDSLIDEAYFKAVKPSTASLKGAGQVEKYKTNVRTAIKDIAQNKSLLPEEKLPQSLQETLSAVEEGKRRVWGQVEKLNQQAGKAGVKIDLNKVADTLDDVIKNKAISIENPGAVEYARALKERLLKAQSLTPQETQELVTNLNSRLSSFFRNPTADTASHSVIDAGIRNNIVKALDDAIETVSDDAAKPLRQLYGSYKSIESDVAKAAARVAKRNTTGLIDYTDIFSGGDIVRGVITANPAEVVRGGFMNAVKNLYKYRNDPNIQIKKLFDRVGGFYEGRSVAPAVSRGITVPVETIKASSLNRFVDDAVKAGAVTPEEVALSETTKGMIETLKAGGSLPPIVVRRTADGLEVVDGLNRLQAYNALKIKDIPITFE